MITLRTLAGLQILDSWSGFAYKTRSANTLPSVTFFFTFVWMRATTRIACTMIPISVRMLETPR